MNDKQVRTHTPEDVKKIISQWMTDHGYATGHAAHDGLHLTLRGQQQGHELGVWGTT